MQNTGKTPNPTVELDFLCLPNVRSRRCGRRGVLRVESFSLAPEFCNGGAAQSPRFCKDFTMEKMEKTPRCCRNFTMVAVPLHHGGVLTAPRWSFDGTMVEWHRHRGVFPDFTTVKCGARRAESGKPAGIFQLSRAAAHILRSEIFPPPWCFFKKALTNVQDAARGSLRAVESL